MPGASIECQVLIGCNTNMGLNAEDRILRTKWKAEGM